MLNKQTTVTNVNNKLTYRGRFAPSPSGHLHFGSLLAATASYLQARKLNGEWWLRIEDIDPPREVKGASQQIIQTLQDYGFNWDNLTYQSQRLDIYQQYTDTLLNNEQAYYCGCSRKEIIQTNKGSNHSATFYPGTCRDGLQGKTVRSIRIKIGKPEVTIDDAIQGLHTVNLNQCLGDFIVKRADGLFSYQLAVAIDDSLQNITQIVRGFDLHESSFLQKYVQQTLGLNQPTYAHIPIAVNNNGGKLSKQSAAKNIATEHPQTVLWHALSCLGQHPPEQLKSRNLAQLWEWSFKNWDMNKIQHIQAVSSPI